MSEIAFPPPADGSVRAASLAQVLGGGMPLAFETFEVRRGTSQPLAVFIIDAGGELPVEDVVAEAEHFGWRYISFTAEGAKIADFGIAASTDESGDISPSILHDPDLADALLNAGMIGEAHAAELKGEYEVRMLRVRYLPDNWLWFAAHDHAADFIVSIAAEPQIAPLYTRIAAWQEIIHTSSEAENYHPEAGA